MFDELLGIAARTGLEVKSRAFRDKAQNKTPFAGGLCTVRGKRLVLLNSNASPVERSVALADALASLADSEVTMSTDARRFLGQRARSRSGVVEPDGPPRPGLAKTVRMREKKPQHR